MNDDKTRFEEEKALTGWLVVLDGSLKGRDFRLTEGKNLVGSSHLADITLDDKDIEPLHFSIRCQAKDVCLTDLDSDSGVFIGEKKIDRQIIPDETVFKAGDSEFLIKILKSR